MFIISTFTESYLTALASHQDLDCLLNLFDWLKLSLSSTDGHRKLTSSKYNTVIKDKTLCCPSILGRICLGLLMKEDR